MARVLCPGMALANRYRFGWGVSSSVEAAAWYARGAAATGRDQYHTVGEQTHVELDRLSDERVDDGTVDDAQRGAEDAMLQAQLQRAEEGDVDALIASGDLLYWGARGFERDHVRARRFFETAAKSGRAQARCLYAAMLLRGEGGDKDHGEAVRQYELAAADGSARALNGLGYEYFYGNTLPKNATKAFGYFEEASRLDADGDSNFNAAHCLATGTGTPRDLRRAADLYERAATRHGHFDAAYEIALVKYEGKGGTLRDAARALEFFDACARAGWAARDARNGFDAFLAADGARAFLWYAEASETGVSVAPTNAAWLIDRDAAARSFFATVLGADARGLANAAVRYHRVSAAGWDAGDSNAALGEAIQQGHLVVHDSTAPVDVDGLLDSRHARALSYYSRAAAAGSARGAFAMARLHATGATDVPRNRDRARRLYETARHKDPNRMYYPVALALALLAADEILERAGFAFGLDYADLPQGNDLPKAAALAALALVLALIAASAVAALLRRPPRPPAPAP